MDSARLDGLVAMITGAGSGLGAATAVRFAAEGAVVVCADLDLDAARGVERQIIDAGGQALAVRLDVTSSVEQTAVAAEVVTRFGRIDVCYANAGIAGPGTAVDTDDATWNAVLDVNLTGVWRTAKAVLPHMVAHRRGSLILQASIGGIIGVADRAPYAAAKGGVIALTKQIAIDYAPFGIRVNAIAPGTVPTGLVLASNDGNSDNAQAALSNWPLGRLGTPRDVAGAALYLAGSDSEWVTGTVLVVDGGRTAG
jgi:NAD(P)-dependent dehydrogenase (short-subunit alcohol dehydrogenase family)